MQKAQIEIWHTKKYAASYYWAAFTLQRKWKLKGLVTGDWEIVPKYVLSSEQIP